MSRSIPSARLERWKREDAAPRLIDQAPTLKQLQLELSEAYNGRRVLDSSRVVHTVVARAAARFEVPCGDARCRDGGHDLTSDIMRNVRQRRRSFVGQDACNGYVGETPCVRILQFVARAEFDPEPSED